MAKGKNGKGKGNPSGTVEALKQQIAALQRKISSGTAQQGSGKKKKRTRRRKSTGTGKARGPKFDLSTLSPFARGMLDPFRASRVRVPDTVYVETMTTTTRTWFSGANGAPVMNYNTQAAYGTVLFAPLAGTQTYKNMHVSFAPDNNGNFFDYGTNATPTTLVWGKGWADSGIVTTYGDTNPLLSKSYRCVGGGLKFSFFEIPDNVTADIYCVPMFNGDTVVGQMGPLRASKIKHFLCKGNDTIILPLPVRHLGEAFEWIDSTKDGFTNASFPADDNLASGKTFKDFAVVGSADNTTANTAINCWSPQSGLGGWQLGIQLPAGSGFRVEAILHWEFLSTGTTNAYWSEEAEISYSNSNHIEGVCNVVSRSIRAETKLANGESTPIGEALNAASEQLRNYTMDALRDPAQALNTGRQMLNILGYKS